MIRISILFVFILTALTTFCQIPGDFITVRNQKGRIVRSFFIGNPITIKTTSNTYASGPIVNIRNDSVYIKTFDIRSYMTSLGVTRVDTFRTFLEGYSRTNIASIKIYQKAHFIREKIYNLLLIGGSGYLILNLINSIYLKQPFFGSSNGKKLAIAGTAVATAVVLKKLFPVSNFSSHKDKISFINMK